MNSTPSNGIPTHYQLAADIMALFARRRATSEDGLAALAVALGQGIALDTAEDRQEEVIGIITAEIRRSAKRRRLSEALAKAGLGALDTGVRVAPND